MRPAIHPRLSNPGPFDDPGLFLSFPLAKKAVLFDLGDLSGLSPKDLLKTTHVFTTHTHMDHFIGFDHLLRVHLGREKILHLYGPEGFLANVAGKLAGYTWNLLDNYENLFGLTVTEVHEHEVLTQSCTTRSGMAFRDPPRRAPFDGVLLSEPDFSVEAAILDHGTPCLGLALKQPFHINIMKARLHEMGLDVGPWLRDFKQALYAQDSWAAPFDAPLPQGGVRTFSLDELAGAIALITPGMKIAYITDVAGHDANQEKILDLARDADHLFIEAAFANEDADRAMARRHLTAGMAGALARRAGAKQMTPFHFSPRYQDDPERVAGQAMDAFQGEPPGPECALP